MEGAIKANLLTVDFCDRKIGELFEQTNMGWGKTSQEITEMEVQIAVWQRFREHVFNGEIITIDEKEQIIWLSNLQTE